MLPNTVRASRNVATNDAWGIIDIRRLGYYWRLGNCYKAGQDGNGCWTEAFQVRHEPEPAGDPYEKMKEPAGRGTWALAIAGQDIGELPQVVDPERKAQPATDFRFFCDRTSR